MTFKVVLEPSEEGGYTVYVPALPGCVSEGDTIEEALQNIREAIEVYLEPTEEAPLIPIARAEFTIAPLLQVPPASRGKPRGARGFGSPCLQGEP